MSRILVVDDERNVLTAFQKLLVKDGHEAVTARSGEEALGLLTAHPPDLVLMDIRMAGLSGLETLKRAKTLVPKVPIVMMTAYGTTETAIDAMKFGAFEYVLKPFDIPALRVVIEEALNVSRLMRNPVSFGGVSPAGDAEQIIGSSPTMYELYKRIGQVAPSHATVLLQGESGTGKELVARAIYHHSQRVHAPFIVINCAAIPETLLESELFGYERGAFTGAERRRIGKFEQANGGTLFLDEIGDMTFSTQAKFLRLLQTQAFDRLGGNETIQVDVRILAATNKDLDALMQSGRFREDLYYRLKVVTITIPPLRERKEDIPRLAEYFLKRYGHEFGKEGLQLSSKALEQLLAYEWSGNVRVLEHGLKQAAVFAKGFVILPEHLRIGALPGTPQTETGHDDAEVLRALVRRQLTTAPSSAFRRVIEQVETQLILEALQQTEGNVAQAAKLLGITRPTLREKVVKYRIQRSVAMGQEGGVDTSLPER